MRQSLQGIRVIAVEQAVAAPLCTRHLADLGAEVIKIERPLTGDFARRYDRAAFGQSAHFVWLNQGKKSVALDLKSADGRSALIALLHTADVLVSNLAPGAFERIVSNEELDELPGLIRCHISGYGTTGPFAHRKAYDLLIQGEAGVIAATGTPEEKARPGVSLADLAGASYAFGAVNAALFERERTGFGQRIDIALFDVLLEWMSPLLLMTRYTGTTPPPTGRRHPSITPYGAYRTADGDEIQIAVQNEGQWQRLCAIVLAQPELGQREEFRGNQNRVARRAQVEGEVAAAFHSLSTATALARLQQADVPYGSLSEVADVLKHPQVVATKRWNTVTLEDNREVDVITPPFVRDPSELGHRRVPRLGEHSQQLLGDLRATRDARRGPQPGQPAPRPTE